MYYIMKSDSSYASGAHKIDSGKTRAEAERKALAFDTKLNGLPMGLTYVLDQDEYDEWNQREVMPFYR